MKSDLHHTHGKPDQIDGWDPRVDSSWTGEGHDAGQACLAGAHLHAGDWVQQHVDQIAAEMSELLGSGVGDPQNKSLQILRDQS